MSEEISDKQVEEWFKNKFKDWCGDDKHKKSKKEKIYKAGGGGLWCIGFIGAVVYYIQTATGFWDGALGVLKAIVWPAFLVHGLLKFLGL